MENTINQETQCSLKEALDCEDESIVLEGFINRYKVDLEEAELIFNETKKWLWLAHKAAREENLNLSIDKPLLVIDEMWHNFILHTKSYTNYCISKFKRFIHHQPTTDTEKQDFNLRIKKNPNLEIKNWHNRYHSQLSYIYDNLGAETVIKWYEELPSKYSENYLKSIKKGL
jgi:hypothetical protein